MSDDKYYNIIKESEYIIEYKVVSNDEAQVPFLTQDMFNAKHHGNNTYEQVDNRYKVYNISQVIIDEKNLKYLNKSLMRSAIDKEGSLIKEDAITRIIKDPAILTILSEYPYHNILPYLSNKYLIHGNRIIHKERHQANKYKKQDKKYAILKASEEKERKRQEALLETINTTSFKQFMRLFNGILLNKGIDQGIHYAYSRCDIKKFLQFVPVYRKFISIDEIKEANRLHQYLPPKGLKAYLQLWSSSIKRDQFINNQENKEDE